VITYEHLGIWLSDYKVGMRDAKLFESDHQLATEQPIVEGGTDLSLVGSTGREEFKSRKILRADSPLEKTLCGHFPKFLAWRKKEFLNLIAECLPVCFETLHQRNSRRTGYSLEFSTGKSKDNGDRFRLIEEGRANPKTGPTTDERQKSPKRIRLSPQEIDRTQQQLVQMLGGVLQELIER
jgi:hypothetical protein